MKYSFHPSAESEHLESVIFYESRQPGLGASYITAFENAMKNIVKTTHQYRIIRHPKIRRKNIKRFPYPIIFCETSAGIQILAIAHNRRRPSYWLKRITK